MSASKSKYYDLDKDLTIEDGHYDKLRESKSPLRRWIHASRYKIINDLVLSFYKEGSVVVDFGCGNCSWNENNLPVVGVDSSNRFLSYALTKARVSKALEEDITKETSLKENSADILVVTEVLEHLIDPHKTLKEIKRVLKPGGILISSAPYDTYLSLWRPLFTLYCFIKGDLLKVPLFLNRAGHINQFSPRKMRNLYNGGNFQIVKQFDYYRLTIFTVGKKI